MSSRRTYCRRPAAVTVARPVLLALSVILLVPGGPASRADTIGTENVVLEFHQDAGAGLVLDFVGDAQQPHAYHLAATDLWSVDLRDPNGHVTTVEPSQATFNFVFNAWATGFTATWEHVTSPAIPGESFDVNVIADISGEDRVVEFSIDVLTATPAHALYALRFPRIEVFAAEPGPDVLTYPYVGGWLLPNPTLNPLVLAATGVPQVQPGPLSMQWLAYYAATEPDGLALFTGTRDGYGYRKEYLIGQGQPGVSWTFAVQHIPEANLTPDNEYAAQFNCVLGVVPGDWYDAARFYRTWALTRAWADGGPIYRNSMFSDYIRNARMFAGSQLSDETHPEDFQFWSRDMADQHAYFDVDTIVTHIYHWHHNLFDVNWGDWWPIKPEFLLAAPELLAAGDVFAPYFLNLTYCRNVPSYDDPYVPGYEGHSVGEYALIDEDGNAVTNTDIQGHVCDMLCLATDFASDYTTYAAERLYQEAGAPGIYLDVFPFDPARVCYDPAHGHPLGGGSYYTQAKVRMVEHLRQYMRAHYDPEYYVYGEAACEPFVGVLELVYRHNTGDSVIAPEGDVWLGIAPLYETVYHDYQFVGTVAPLHSQMIYDDFTYQLNRRIYAAHLFMGHVPWAGTSMGPLSMFDVMADSPGYALLADMVRRIMTVLKLDDVRDFVYFGERAREPLADAPVISKLEGDQFLPYGGEQPLVYTTTYVRPDYHGLGLALFNWSDASDEYIEDIPGGDQTVSWSLRHEDFKLTAGRYVVTLFGPDGITTLPDLLTLPEIFQGTTFVPARSAVFVRILLAGDITGDGKVCLDDLARLLAHYGQTSGARWKDGDLNADGRVLLDDLALLLGNYGIGGCP